MSIRTWAQAVGVVAIVVAATWWVFRDTDMAHVWDIVTSTGPASILATIPIIVASHVIRAIRWTLLLRPATGKVRLWPAFSAVMIGYAASVVIPRSGEVFRPWVLSRRVHIPLSMSISSVLVERLVDVITLLAGLGMLLLWRRDMLVSVIPWLTPSLIATGIVLPAVILVTVLITLAYTGLGRAISAWVTRRFPKYGHTVTGTVESVQQGMSVLRTPITWVMLFVLTAAMWFLYVLPLLILMKAMPWPGAQDITVADAAIVLVIISVGVTIAPTPGALGIYQGFAQAAIVRLYGASDAVGAGFGILAWITNYSVAFIGGGICFVIELLSGAPLSLRAANADVRSQSRQHDEMP